MGITHVWFPPPSDSTGGAGYLPRQLNILDSTYGSRDDLANVLRAFNDRGVKAIADIVVNHRVGTTGDYRSAADFTNPSWSLYSVVNNDECGCGLGSADTGDNFPIGRDLDHTNVEEVQKGIITWLNDVLKPVGFSGIRFDYARGFSPYYFGLYASAMDSEFCVGELWDDFNARSAHSNRNQILDWIARTDKSCGAFDFTTKGLLNDALEYGNYWGLRGDDGRPQGVIGYWPEMAVTFVDNHDTGPAEYCGSGQNMWPVPCDKVAESYAYILTHPGIPSIYYPHIYDWNHKQPIADLIRARKTAGVTSTSQVYILEATQGLYAAIISGHNNQLAMKIGPNYWNPGEGWNLQTEGPNYSVWIK